MFQLLAEKNTVSAQVVLRIDPISQSVCKKNLSKRRNVKQISVEKRFMIWYNVLMSIAAKCQGTTAHESNEREEPWQKHQRV